MLQGVLQRLVWDADYMPLHAILVQIRVHTCSGVFWVDKKSVSVELRLPGWFAALHKSTRQPEGYERTQGPPIHLLPILGGDDENGGI